MANCTGIERSRPRLARMAAICSAFAASPARIAAGSPGVSRSMRNTSTATMSSTGIVANNRRTMNPTMKKPLRKSGSEPDFRHQRNGYGKSGSDPDFCYGALWFRFVKLVFLHVPVGVSAADHQPADVLAGRIGIDVFAERRMRAYFEGAHLDLLGDGLSLRGVGLARELVAQLLD